MRHIHVGVDGGGTRATALAVDPDGAPLARCMGEAGRVDSSDPLAGVPALEALVREAIEAAGASPPAVSLCCALAGVGREAVRDAVERALTAPALAQRVRVVTDAEAALFDAFGEGAGVLLIAGTGSIAWGRRADGAVARVGGWGMRLGDEGSGYSIGLAGLRAVAHAADGRAAATALSSPILEHTATREPADLIAWVDTASKGEIAALAPVVLAAAATGDPAAQRIVERAAHDLAAHVAALLSRLPPSNAPPRIALAGGLLTHASALRPAVEATIRARMQACIILPDSPDGARGAAALARAAPRSPADGTG